MTKNNKKIKKSTGLKRLASLGYGKSEIAIDIVYYIELYSGRLSFYVPTHQLSSDHYSKFKESTAYSGFSVFHDYEVDLISPLY
jgi:hypothetical protein